MTARPSSAVPAVPYLRRVAADALEGFTEASGPAALCMAAAFAPAVGVTAWFVSPATLAGPWGAFLAGSPHGAEGFVTRRALRLAATPAAAPRLLVLGPSALAQALGDPSDVERALGVEPDVPWEVHMPTTPLQSPFEQVVLGGAFTLLHGRAPLWDSMRLIGGAFGIDV